jgi:hypothetical protein
VVEGDLPGGQRPAKLVAAGLCREKIGLDHLKAVPAREGLGAGTSHQDVLAGLHQRAGGAARPAHPRDARDSAGPQGGAVHDRGVEFVGLGAGEDGAVAGIEERALLQEVDGDTHGVEGAPAVGEAGRSGRQDSGEGRVVARLVGIGLARRDRPGTAVDHEYGAVVAHETAPGGGVSGRSSAPPCGGQAA